jgi:hypothetical protein
MEVCEGYDAGRVGFDQMVCPPCFALLCSGRVCYFCTFAESVNVIFSYDSVEDGSVSILTPHTAFEDPTTPEGTPLRESIELRALVFYDD